MNTGLGSFADPASIGPMYPFVGSEWLLTLILLVAWVAWQIYFTMAEDREFAKAAKLYRDKGLLLAGSEAETDRVTAEVRAAILSHA